MKTLAEKSPPLSRKAGDATEKTEAAGKGTYGEASPASAPRRGCATASHTTGPTHHGRSMSLAVQAPTQLLRTGLHMHRVRETATKMSFALKRYSIYVDCPHRDSMSFSTEKAAPRPEKDFHVMSEEAAVQIHTMRARGCNGTLSLFSCLHSLHLINV